MGRLFDLPTWRRKSRWGYSRQPEPMFGLQFGPSGSAIANRLSQGRPTFGNSGPADFGGADAPGSTFLRHAPPTSAATTATTTNQALRVRIMLPPLDWQLLKHEPETLRARVRETAHRCLPV